MDRLEVMRITTEGIRVKKEKKKEARQMETSKNVSSVYLRYGSAEAELMIQGWTGFRSTVPYRDLNRVTANSDIPWSF